MTLLCPGRPRDFLKCGVMHHPWENTGEQLLEEARDRECSAELTEKLWRFGRYLFISGTNKKGFPFPLYGLWTSGYNRCWTQNVANENVESIYWHINTGGLAETIIPVIHYYYKKMDVFRESARKFFGCRGIFVSTYTTPVNSTPAPYVPVIIHFNGVAGWLSRHFYDYYLITQDEKLLNDEILPFMTEAAQFYEDYIQYDEAGNVFLYPSVSPENSPEQFMQTERPTASGHQMPVTRNAAVEIAIMKELLTNLVSLSKTHPSIAAKADTWKYILSKLPDYRINSEGAIAEWIDPEMKDNYFHRHLSHIYPVFPGTEIENSGRTELIPNFKKAVELRKLGSFTGWALSHMSSIYSRLHDADNAYSMINMYSKVCLLDNLFGLHNDYRGMGITTSRMGNDYFAPIQLDGPLGMVNAIQEMLITVFSKKITILPALPAQLSKGSADKLHFFGGTADIRWDADRKYCKVTITAQRAIDLTVVLPFGGDKKEIHLAKGEQIILQSS